ncbi:hypothetical protein B0T25DRAFT_555280 [Lasiosphaeria hispida]|uniref:Chromatin modification-related protein n=1 Tax=Lasiosphaeria hispida TaxID=260671 RepID=A0AAJ0H969_9PEZI|nr:hypothetical protein B0T25DRAFT_636421 [Lasiosphaeria hispida]KAK3343828.1 hypothetical protein B0T25DRAFT_555280 [Lasiosphaeria hispida]
MKTAKPPAPEGSASSNRRAQPVRQTRTNPPRTSSLNRGNSFASSPVQEQPIDIFPAVTHFADAITALPKELVRHFTLLKEVDAKIFAPEAALFQLLDAARKAPIPDPARSLDDASSSVAPASAPMSAQNSSSGAAPNTNLPAVLSNDGSAHAALFDPSNLPRRQLFRQTAFKIQEMLVSLEEKNHVISTANDALQKQLGRIEEIWPHLKGEFSEEAKWGSTTHWAYADNRTSKASNAQAERSRREGAATLSAAAQQLAEEAAARSSDRKQALAAKKNSKAHAAEAEADGKPQETTKKSQGNKSRKTPADAAAPVGLGISATAPTTASAPSKRRKVDHNKTNGGAPMERALSSVFGGNAPKTKTTSPRETPAPENGSKKRKALPTSSNQAKKRTTTAMSPSVVSSPLVGTFPDSIKIGRSSPVPLPTIPRPALSRARQNSAQSSTENARQRPPSAASNKPNGAPPSIPEPVVQSNGVQPNADIKAPKEIIAAIPTKPEPAKPEVEAPPPPPEQVPNGGKKEAIAKTIEELPKRDSATPILPPTPIATVKTKSGRASKPSTPALATFAEAQAASNPRSRPSRNAESGTGGPTATAAVTMTTTTTITTTATAKRSHKKGASVSAAAAALITVQAAFAPPSAAVTAPVNREDPRGGNHSSGNKEAQPQDDDDEADGDEPRYCFCNQVSYGEMVGCDAEGCPREWFHLECVGLEVAPKGKAKWYCEDCKKRLRTARNG